MSKMLKSFITYGLSILLLSATLHVDLGHHDHYDGYSICDIDCDDEKHHSIDHQCERCLNKTNRMIVQECIDFSLDDHGELVYSLNERFNLCSIPYFSYSRPPPSLL